MIRFHFQFPRSPDAAFGGLIGWLFNWKCKFSCRIISNITNHLKYNYFWDGDGIDNVTLRLWKFSDFCSRHSVGVAGDDIMFHILVFSCDQAALWMVFSVCPSVCLSVCLSHLFHYHHRIIMKFSGVITNDQRDVYAKGQGQRSRSQRSKPNLTVSGLWLKFEFTYDDEMKHKARWCLEEVPYCFSKSSIKFQGNTGWKIYDLNPISFCKRRKPRL